MDIFLQDVLIKICSDGPRPSEGGREGVWAGRQAGGCGRDRKAGQLRPGLDRGLHFDRHVMHI